MDLSDYFSPVSADVLRFAVSAQMPTLGQCASIYQAEGAFPSLDRVRIAIVGVGDERGSGDNRGCDGAPDAIRRMLYPLTVPVTGLRLADLGNLVPGATLSDTCFALAEVLYKLIEHNIVAIILGGSQALTFAQYRAYEILGRIITLLSIDAKIDILDGDLSATTYLNQIVQQNPNYLFSHISLGYQSYFCHPMVLSLLDDIKFDAYRLGEIQDNMTHAEPLIRMADAISVDISAVRQSDAPAQAHPSPHGFYGEQLCQMARFAGMSDKLSSFGIYEVNPRYDHQDQTAHMVAHALWYFIEGVYGRKDDSPHRDTHSYKRYCVHMADEGLDIMFYKSRKTDRWWMEVPDHRSVKDPRYARQLLIPCVYEDYEQALHNRLPDRWWKYYQRYNN